MIFTFGDLKNLSIQKNRPLVLELGLSRCLAKFEPQYTLLGRNEGPCFCFGLLVCLWFYEAESCFVAPIGVEPQSSSCLSLLSARITGMG